MQSFEEGPHVPTLIVSLSLKNVLASYCIGIGHAIHHHVVQTQRSGAIAGYRGTFLDNLSPTSFSNSPLSHSGLSLYRHEPALNGRQVVTASRSDVIKLAGQAWLLLDGVNYLDDDSPRWPVSLWLDYCCHELYYGCNDHCCRALRRGRPYESKVATTS